MKRTGYWLAIIVVSALILGGLVFCSGSDQSRGRSPVDRANRQNSERWKRNSFLMALEEVNKAGGINGRPIELLIEDDTGKPDVGRSAVEKLISQDKVIFLSGGYSSQVTYAICQMAQQRKIPFLVTTGSADDITEKGWNYVFRINPAASEYAKALFDFLKEVVKPKTVAILYENSSLRPVRLQSHSSRIAKTPAIRS